MFNSDCACGYDGDYEPCEFYYEEVRKARKQHRCAECRGPINPGDHYMHRVGKWDGEVSVYKTCQPCMNIIRSAPCVVPFGELRQYLISRYGFDQCTIPSED
jgi:hypothetical protein